MRILILGGTGVIGSAVARECVAHGIETTVVARGRRPGLEGVEWALCDRNDSAGLKMRFVDRRFEAVVDLLSFDAEDAEQTIELFGSRCSRMLFISSVAAYKRPLRSLPCRENTEELWENPQFEYGYQKAEMERFLRGRIAAGLPLTIVRPALTFGPGARNFGVLRQNAGVVDRIRRGKRLILFGDGTAPWHFTFASDMAAAIVALLMTDASVGETCHIAGGVHADWRELYRELGRIVGVEPEFAFLPSSAFFGADETSFGHIFYEKAYPGLFDISRLRDFVPRFQPEKGLKEGLAELVAAWNEERVPINPVLDCLEDRLVEISLSAAVAVKDAVHEASL